MVTSVITEGNADVITEGNADVITEGNADVNTPVVAPSTTGPSHDILSQEFLTRVEAVLDEHDIRHGRLREGAPQFNLNATDRAHVFVKVTRRAQPGSPVGGPTLDREVRSAAWALKHGIRTPLGLIDRVIRLDERHTDGSTSHRHVAVWSFIEATGNPALIDRATDLVDAVASIAHVPAPTGAVTIDPLFYRDRSVARLAGRRDTDTVVVSEMMPLLADLVAPAWTARPAAWVHSDLHLNNAIWGIDSRPTILDWESAGIGPVEADIAQIIRSTWSQAPGYGEDYRIEVSRRVLERAESLMDIDRRLVIDLVRYRAGSSASHLLLHPGLDPERLRVDLALLRDPMAWAASGPGRQRRLGSGRRSSRRCHFAAAPHT